MSDAEELRRICEQHEHPVYEEPNEDEKVPDRNTRIGTEGHLVRQGECISSIAFRYGHVWETIWNDAKNGDLKRARKDPNVLLPGDRVFIPELREKQESRATEKKHRFRRRDIPAEVEVFFLDAWEPREGVEYEACVDNGPIDSGKLDDKGGLKVPVPPDARRLVVTLTREDGSTEEHRFELGAMDPVTEPSGYRRRLHQLGLLTPPHAPDEDVADTLRAFQRREGLDETGEPDAKTLDALREKNGS